MSLTYKSTIVGAEVCCTCVLHDDSGLQEVITKVAANITWIQHWFLLPAHFYNVYTQNLYHCVFISLFSVDLESTQYERGWGWGKKQLPFFNSLSFIMRSRLVSKFTFFWSEKAKKKLLKRKRRNGFNISKLKAA